MLQLLVLRKLTTGPAPAAFGALPVEGQGILALHVEGVLTPRPPSLLPTTSAWMVSLGTAMIQVARICQRAVPGAVLMWAVRC